MVKNSGRIFVECLREYCVSKGVEVISYSHDWIFHLSKGERRHVVIGYDLGVNSSSSAQICSDKAATFDVLDSHRVPSVPHHLFLEPWKMQFVEKDGNWGEMISLHRFYGGRSIIKQNDGTGGRGVFLAENVNALEEAVQKIFSRERSVALSPYLEIEKEVRYYIANSRPLICYEKCRPSVIGDGVSSVMTLAAKTEADFSIISSENVDWKYIPQLNEEVVLAWKHNLGGGATMSRVGNDELPQAKEIALSAFQVLGLSAASVDVVCVDGSWSVLEVNTGIMIENAYRSGAISRAEAQEIYKDIIALIGM